MTGIRLIETAGVLGLYVLFAGMFALAYTFARMRSSRAWFVVAAASYALHLFVGAGVVALSPLQIGWKALLVASSLAVLVIPAVTWHLLEHSHAGIQA